MKKVLAIVVAVAMLATVIGIFTLASANASIITARFEVMEDFDAPGVDFSMISGCGEWIIHISDSIPVNFEGAVPLCDDCDEVTTNAREVLFGRTLAEVLDGRQLQVQFAVQTMSIPAQTTPISVTILFESIVALPAIEIETGDGYQNIMTLPGDISDLDFDDDFYVGLEWEYFDWSDWEDEVWVPELNGELVINNEIVYGAPAPFWAFFEDGMVAMVPLRAIAEGLGYDVEWNEYTQSIMLGVGIHVFIGRTEAYLGRMAPIELSVAPMIYNNSTFVSLDFVSNVLGQNVWVFEGQVVIDSEYEMY